MSKELERQTIVKILSFTVRKLKKKLKMQKRFHVVGHFNYIDILSRTRLYTDYVFRHSAQTIIIYR